MLDIDLSELLKRMEGETIDFKTEMYSFDGADKEQKIKKRAQFIKDIVSMYNTPRDEPAYIILGVKETEDGKREITGVAKHLDLADLDSQLAELVHPVPRILYHPLVYNSLDMAVITIPPQRSIGPVFANTTVGGTLIRNQLYLRRNSKNVEANPDEMKRVFAWFSEDMLPKPQSPVTSGNWDILMGCLSGLSDSHYNVLIVDVPLMPNDQASYWSGINWAFVADLDARSDVSGLLSMCKGGLSRRRQLHLLVKGDRVAMIPERSTYWYCASGYEGRQTTMPKSGKWVDWNRAYGADIREKVTSFAAAAGDRPINLLCAWYTDRDASFLGTILDGFQSELGDRLNIAVVSDSISSDVSRIANANEATTVEIPLAQLSIGLASLSESERRGSSEAVLLPTSSGAPFEVPAQKQLWISEEADLVSESIGNTPERRSAPGSDFLRGNEISWYELGLNCDVPRGILTKLEAAMRRGLESRRAMRVNLFHQPGAGGTTISRRVLWLFHRSYPTILLRAYSDDTIARLEYLSHMTKMQIIVGVDAGSITDRQADQLFDQLRARNVAAVMFQTLRRSTPPTSMERSFYLESKLDDDDLNKFIFYLAREVPSRKNELERVRNDSQGNLRTAFYLALVAFGRDFLRLSDYVADRISNLSENQQTCLVYLSISHLYGQRAIPEQMFADLFGVPQSKRVDLTRAFEGLSTLELLSNNGNGDWRTSHVLIAEECLSQILGKNFDDKRAWKQLLSKVSKNFIDFCRSQSTRPNQDGMDIVQRVFVFRGNSEMIGYERSASTVYAELIEAIPSSSGRLEVLRHLTDSFPDEPHFWAHLSRFLSGSLGEFPEAISAIDFAISLSPSDHVLRHVKGMVHRSQANAMISNKDTLDAVIDVAEKAAESFDQARTLQPSEEHAYVSEAQMILSVLDYAVQTKSKQASEIASDPLSPIWVRESFQRVEDLLDRLCTVRRGDMASEYEIKCRARLDYHYGEHQLALQKWNNLLDRKGIHHPPIRRQVVWAYFARAGRDWNSVPQSDIQRAIKLLSENMDEEPNEARNLRLWLKAVRALRTPPNLDSVLEQVAYWHTNTGSLESGYYLWCLQVLKAIEGSGESREQARRLAEENRNRSKFLRNNTKSFEWLGPGEGVKRLVQDESLSRDEHSKETTKLTRYPCVITRIDRPEAGELEIEGMPAFFAPGRSGHYRGEAENRRVTAHIGFSYSGLRAWAVADAE
jgi:hypothetical protein